MVSEFVNDQIHSIAREIDKKDRIPKDMVGKLGEMLLRGINVYECDVEHFFRESKILEIVEGPSSIQRIVISNEIIKNAMIQ